MSVRKRNWKAPRNGELLAVLRREAFNEQEGMCYWCGRKMTWKGWHADPLTCTADHVVPRSRGGTTTKTNIVAACRQCNNSRQELSTPEEVRNLIFGAPSNDRQAEEKGIPDQGRGDVPVPGVRGTDARPDDPTE